MWSGPRAAPMGPSRCWRPWRERRCDARLAPTPARYPGEAARPRCGLVPGAVGEYDLGDGSGGHSHLQAQDVRCATPRRLDAAVGRVVDGVGPVQSATRLRLDAEAPITGMAVQ